MCRGLQTAYQADTGQILHYHCLRNSSLPQEVQVTPLTLTSKGSKYQGSIGFQAIV